MIRHLKRAAILGLMLAVLAAPAFAQTATPKGWIASTYAWVKDNDLSNTFTFFVTFILWPLGLFWWTHRKVDNVPNLLIAFTPASPITIGRSFPAVGILFENQTGSIVYVTGPRLRNCSKLFLVPTEAVRDIGENAHPLSFWSGRLFENHQATLQTSAKIETVMAVTTAMPDLFYRYKTPYLRRIFRRPKFFILEYTAMVGDKRYSVSTIY
jgi:hypothetical protein